MVARLLRHYASKSVGESISDAEEQRIYDFQALQDNINIILDEIADKPHLDSFLIEDVSIGTTETLIRHKLNRKVRGYYIVRKNGLANIYDNIATSSTNLSHNLPLISSVAVTVSLIVF